MIETRVSLLRSTDVSHPECAADRQPSEILRPRTTVTG